MLIYAIGAVIVWVAVNIVLLETLFRHRQRDSGGNERVQEIADSDIQTRRGSENGWRELTGFIISIPAALMWWGTPLIVGGLILYDTIQEKNPELCGFTAEEFDKEENK